MCLLSSEFKSFSGGPQKMGSAQVFFLNMLAFSFLFWSQGTGSGTATAGGGKIANYILPGSDPNNANTNMTSMNNI